MSKWLSPASIAWVICHLAVAAVGLMFVGSPIFLNTFGESIAQGIGGSLIATGIAGEFLFLYLRASDTVRARLDAFLKAGLLTVFPVRSMQIRSEYDARLSNAREIDVLGFGLSSLREDYMDQFAAWSQRARIRILLLDPDFPCSTTSYSDQRDREEGNPQSKIRRDVQAFLAAVESLPGINPARFQVRLMRALPSINFFRVDDQLFWGPYLVGRQSRNSPTLLVRRGGFLFDPLKDHFDALWSDRHSVPIN